MTSLAVLSAMGVSGLPVVERFGNCLPNLGLITFINFALKVSKRPDKKKNKEPVLFASTQLGAPRNVPTHFFLPSEEYGVKKALIKLSISRILQLQDQMRTPRYFNVHQRKARKTILWLAEYDFTKYSKKKTTFERKVIKY